MTPNEITTLLASQFPDMVFDMPFKLMMMKRVNAWRSRLIKNALDKNPNERKFFRQKYYVDMHDAYPSTAAALVMDQPLSISINDFPQLVRANGILFDYIGGIDGRSSFREALNGMQNYLALGRFSSLFPSYSFSQSLEVSKKGIPRVLVEAIFDDPLAVMNSNCKCGTGSCDVWDNEYPCSGDIMQLIIQSITSIDFNRQPQPTDDEIPVSDKK